MFSRQRMLARQRGVAVITALLLTTLAITIVASLFWEQQVQVRSMENQRLHLQTKWILHGALDWASLVLKQDGWDNRDATTLKSVWNTPLAETRLDQYIERERVQNEVFDATLSGHIVDATSRLNLRNLAFNNAPAPLYVAIYKRLLESLHLDPSLAVSTAKAFAASMPAQAVVAQGGASPGGTTSGTGAGTGSGSGAGTGAGATAVGSSSPAATLTFERLDDLLAIDGYTPEIIAKLHDFVIVLPEPTLVNVNTAPAEVLAALVENYSVAQANALVSARERIPYFHKGEFGSQFITQTKPNESTYDVKSNYFLVLSRVRLDRAALDAEALVHRGINGLGANMDTNVVWIRQN